MTRILLTRHGETVWNSEGRMQGRKNSPLTDNGIKGASDLGRKIADDRILIDHCLVSPMPRALHTAHLIRKNSGFDYKIDIEPLLIEMDLGSWEGMRCADAISSFPEMYGYFKKRPDMYVPVDGGETFKDIYDRSVLLLDKIKERYDGTVLLVSHMILVQGMLCAASGNSLSELRDNSPIAQTTLYEIDL